ncbi:hypothetical protein GSI_13896 [Ganoderma sinense ZZ0214-1]|uniref:Fe2OG dioxygenase domain-containing protein n=1 Tax=Ganoderma sinense ZZ0214-1 TaxID=1077348 RepID=A0A2G8RRL4_9APHY|nr:hypothetical protein GSI_13896 [Ganoderma sinense ZZ0214-1]
MDGADLDTETMLAILSSLLHPLEFEHTVLLDALVKAQGDVELAARSLRPEPPRKKRKVSQKAGLQGWLKSGDKGHDSQDKAISSASANPDKFTPRRASSPAVLGTNVPGGSESSFSSPRKPSSRAKAVSNIEFMALFRPLNSSDSSSKPQAPRHPPLALVSPDHVAQHTPCTLHSSILPQELACRLFYTMLHASRDWNRNKWWLFDRVVESPHRTSFFVRRDISQAGEGSDLKEEAKYWYNGRPTDPPLTFPSPMEEACEIIERVVNEEMRKRKRYPLEWAGYPVKDGEEPVLWRANVAASNCYEGAKESVGFHSDQLTYLGPYPTIASLSLGVSRIFRLREVIPTDEKDQRNARTFNVPLRHNSLIIMHASCQEVFKHCIPAQNTIDMFRPPMPPPVDLAEEEELAKLSEGSNARINITFRFYRPDFRSQLTPHCKCGVPCILRPDMKNRYEAPPGNDLNAKSEPWTSTSEGEGSGKRSLASKYWWTCYAGAQNDGHGCGFWKVMDVKAEGRGPFVGDMISTTSTNK